jgi:hypothetical protein
MYQTVCEKYGKKSADLPYVAIVGGGLMTGSPVFLLTSYVLYTASIVAENDIKSALRARRYGVTRGSKILRRTQFATAALSLCIGVGAQTISNKFFTPSASTLSTSGAQTNFMRQSAPTEPLSYPLLNSFKLQADAATKPTPPHCIPCVEPRVEAIAPQTRPKEATNAPYDAFAI